MLKNWLNRRRDKKARTDNEADTRYEQLERLAQRHSFVDVSFSRIGRSYQSMIVGLRPELGELILDEMFPPEGVSELARGDLAEVTHRDSQFPLHFVTRLLGREQIDGNPAYRVELPASVGASGSRRAYRVYVETEEGLALDITCAEGEPLYCRVVNLSVEGLKIDIDGDHSKTLQRQHLFTDCLLQLPSGDNIECDIDIRNFSCLQKPALHTLAGGVLKIEQPHYRVRLNRYLATVQRRQLRREMRTFS